MLNRVIIMGRIVVDPELRSTQTGIPVCTLRVAVDRSFVRAGEQRESDFFDVVTWRQTAEFVSKYFSKGRMIAVEGRLQTRKWKDKNDQTRVSKDIVADNVYFCGDRRDDYRSSDDPVESRYGDPPPERRERYSADAASRYSPSPASAASTSASIPAVSDFSELEDEVDDKVPF